MKREPVLIGAVVQIAVVTAAAFGLELEAEAVTAVAVGVMALVGIIQRSLVSPAS